MSLDLMRAVEARAWEAVQDGEDSWWTRPSSARTVLLGLAYFVNGESGHAYPSLDRLAAFIGLSTRQVRRGLVELIDLGLIEPVDKRKGGRNRPTRYRIVYGGEVVFGEVVEENPDTMAAFDDGKADTLAAFDSGNADTTSQSPDRAALKADTTSQNPDTVSADQERTGEKDIRREQENARVRARAPNPEPEPEYEPNPGPCAECGEDRPDRNDEDRCFGCFREVWRREQAEATR